MNRPIRQGDVYLVPVKAIPDKSQPIERTPRGVVLAWGEVTGHAHVIDSPEATLLTADEERRFLRLMTDATLVHEEHTALTIPAGDYEVIIHEEWEDAMGPQRVLD